MCRNHSHVTGTLISARNVGEYTEVQMLVEQPLTLELLTGAQLTLPPYVVLLLRQDHPGLSLGNLQAAMAGPESSLLPRDVSKSPSGHTTPPK